MNSDWTVKVARDATKQLEKPDPQVARRILNYLRRLAADPDPTRLAERLKGSLAMLSRYRIGDYRIICELNREACTITVLRVAHRREVYRK